jgi:hypothetical protein
MPDASTFWFLNPRTLMLGLNLSFHFKYKQHRANQ